MFFFLLFYYYFVFIILLLLCGKCLLFNYNIIIMREEGCLVVCGQK